MFFCWFVLFLPAGAYGSQAEMNNGVAKAGGAGLVLPLCPVQRRGKSYNIRLIHKNDSYYLSQCKFMFSLSMAMTIHLVKKKAKSMKLCTLDTGCIAEHVSKHCVEGESLGCVGLEV